MAPLQPHLARRFQAVSASLARAASAPGLRQDPGLAPLLRAGEDELRALRAEVEGLAAVRDAFAGVRAKAGDGAPVERLKEELLAAYHRAGPHLGSPKPPV